MDSLVAVHIGPTNRPNDNGKDLMMSTYTRLRALQLSGHRDVREAAYALNRAREYRLQGMAHTRGYADRVNFAAHVRQWFAGHILTDGCMCSDGAS